MLSAVAWSPEMYLPIVTANWPVSAWQVAFWTTTKALPVMSENDAEATGVAEAAASRVSPIP